MPPKPWKTLSSRPIYANKWTQLREAEVLDLVLTSEIRDGMTVIAVLHAARLRGM